MGDVITADGQASLLNSLCTDLVVVQDIRRFPLPLLSRDEQLGFSSVQAQIQSPHTHTVCSRSLDPIHIVRYYISCGKTSWTYRCIISIVFVISYLKPGYR